MLKSIWYMTTTVGGFYSRISIYKLDRA